MHSELKDQGFEVFAFPCNQFGGQEPGTPQEINEFARGKYGAEFPIFQKIDVNGSNCHPVYNYLRSHSELYDEKKQVASEIPWNFAKFLVDRDGKTTKYFNPKTDPLDIKGDIEKILQA